LFTIQKIFSRQPLRSGEIIFVQSSLHRLTVKRFSVCLFVPPACHAECLGDVRSLVSERSKEFGRREIKAGFGRWSRRTAGSVRQAGGAECKQRCDFLHYFRTLSSPLIAVVIWAKISNKYSNNQKGLWWLLNPRYYSGQYPSIFFL